MRPLAALALAAAVFLVGCSTGEISVKDQENKKAALDKVAGVDSSKPQEP